MIIQSSNMANFNNNNNNNNTSGSKANKQSIKLDDLEEAYIKQFGYQLRPDTYGENSVVALLGIFTFNIPNWFERSKFQY